MPAPSPSAVSRTQQALEWPRVLEALAAYAHSSLGANACRTLSLEETVESARLRMQETTEMVELLNTPTPFPILQFNDPSHAVLKVEKGGALDLKEFRDLSVLVKASGAVRRCLVANQRIARTLCSVYASVPDLSDLQRAIDQCVSAEGDVLERASPALYEAIQTAQNLKQRMRHRLESMVASSRHRDLLQEPYFTQHENRYVLPIKTERRHDLQGIVHSVSASGATVFMEPRELIDLNNRIKVAESQVSSEINGILRDLTCHVSNYLQDVKRTLRTLTTLDCIAAKARLSVFMKGTSVQLNERGHIRLRKARHPLLLTTKKDVVPNDVTFEKEYRVLVISGPNTGGKTVTMKLLGLFSFMVRSGLLPPCGEGSEMAFFRETFADVGDMQDLTNDLSSFSAHVIRIVGLLRRVQSRPISATTHVFVLLDEVIGSTDPAEGAALAEALLRRFVELNVKIVVTTHYHSLKVLALSTPGVLNASLECDANTFTPTYRLISGLPGGSSAFDVAAQLGMDPSILDCARSLIAHDDRQLDHLFADLQRTQRMIHEELQQARKQREIADQDSKQAREILERLRAVEREECKQMKKRFRERLRAARSDVLEVVESLRRERRWETAQAAQRRLQNIEASVVQQTERRRETVPFESLKEGDVVEIVNLETLGRLREMPQGKKRVRVQVGSAELSVQSDRIIGRTKGEGTQGSPVSPHSTTASTTSRPVEATGQLTSSETERDLTSIDLRGHLTEGALERLAAKLDHAVLYDVGHIRIIHGHGTGKLRIAIRRYLAQSLYVASFRPGTRAEGSDGVTVADLK